MTKSEKDELDELLNNFLRAKKRFAENLQKFSNKSNDQVSNKEDHEHINALKLVRHLISVEEVDGKDSKLKISLKEEVKEEGGEDERELLVLLMKSLMNDNKNAEGIDQKMIDQCKNEGFFIVEDNDKVRNIFKELGITHPQEERPNSTTSPKSAAENLKNDKKGKNGEDDFSR